MSRPLLDECVADTCRRSPSDQEQRHAALLVADTLGLMLAGGRRPEAQSLVIGDELTGRWRHDAAGAGPAARFLTTGHGWGAPDRVAYVNATACCALELDEGIRPTGHPAAHVLPAALAAAEVVDASWQDLLAAFIAGYEVTARLFTAIRLRAPMHPHGHLGAIGSAVAVSLLCGDDPLAAARVAGTLPLLTTWTACFEGANARDIWVGHAAATGLLARRVVHAGYRGSEAGLDSAFNGLVGDRSAAANPAAAGSSITSGYLKLYSACAITHSAIEAALPLGPFAAESLESVRVRVNANSVKAAAAPADNELSRRFSLPYAVAVALLHADATPQRFDVPDAEAVALTRAVSVAEDPEMTAAWPHRAPAAVTIILRSGEVRTAEVSDAYGHPGNPADRSAVRDKFRTLTGLPQTTWDLLTDAKHDLAVRRVMDALTSEGTSTPPVADR